MDFITQNYEIKIIFPQLVALVILSIYRELMNIQMCLCTLCCHFCYCLFFIEACFYYLWKFMCSLPLCPLTDLCTFCCLFRFWLNIKYFKFLNLGRDQNSLPAYNSISLYFLFQGQFQVKNQHVFIDCLSSYRVLNVCITLKFSRSIIQYFRAYP